MIVELKWQTFFLIVLFQAVISAQPITTTTGSTVLEPLGTTSGDSELLTSKQKLCGDAVHKIMQEICALHNAPILRKRREIAKDCCPSENRNNVGCSIQYLATYYCQIVNKDGVKKVIDQMKKKRHQQNEILPQNQLANPQNLIIKNHNVRLKNKILSRRYRQRMLMNHESSSLHYNKHEKPQKQRGKRNCTCKKFIKSFKPASGGEVGMIEEDGDAFYVFNSGNDIK